MEIDNSRLFIADVHKVDYRVDNVEYVFGDVSMGCTDYLTSEYKKNVVLVAFKTKHKGTQYVPISYIKNMLGYFSVKIASKGDTHFDKRFISETALCAGSNKLFLEDLQNLYEVEGKTSIKELKDVQTRHNNADNYIAGTL